MSSCKNITPVDPKNYKIKVCLLGGTEIVKNEFQKCISSQSLAIENKYNIGVNISKFELTYSTDKFEVYLWNIDCNQKFAPVRTIFYHGAEAVLIFIPENKIEQIRSYLNEIKIRFPIIQLHFCILLGKYRVEAIKKKIVRNLNLSTIMESNNITFHTASNPHQIFEGVCSNFIEKKNMNINEDKFVINLLDLKYLLKDIDFNYECEDYCEPITYPSELNQKLRINRDVVIDCLLDLGIQIKEDPSDYLIIENKDGIFSIFLRNGNVYFIPRICHVCTKKKCPKYNKQFFICIEQTTMGWSNKQNLRQSELLLLSKIIAIKNSELPPTILTQINKVNTCIKDKSLH